MVEINNQRKAFLDMLAWSEGTTDVRKPEIIVMTSTQQAETFTLLDHLATCHTPTKNSNQQAPDATSFFPVGGMPQAAWPERLLSEKVRTLWHCSRLRSVALYL